MKKVFRILVAPILVAVFFLASVLGLAGGSPMTQWDVVVPTEDVELLNIATMEPIARIPKGTFLEPHGFSREGYQDVQYFGLSGCIPASVISPDIIDIWEVTTKWITEDVTIYSPSGEKMVTLDRWKSVKLVDPNYNGEKLALIWIDGTFVPILPEFLSDE